MAAEAGDTMEGMISRLVMDAFPRQMRVKTRAIPSPNNSGRMIDGKIIMQVWSHERRNRLSSSISF